MINTADRKWDVRRFSLCFAAISAIPLTAASARAVEPVADEIECVMAVNRAMLGVCSARLAREQWKLDKLDLLRNRGHASWREVARQQVAVETLDAHRRAADRFAQYVEELRRRVEPDGDPPSDHQSPTSPAGFAPPIKLSLPGSVRLIAWIEADQMPLEITARENASLDEPAQEVQKNASQVDVAKRNLADAEKRVRGLTSIAGKPGIANELERARLDLAVAVAEFEWRQARLQWQQSPARRGASRQTLWSARQRLDRDNRAAIAVVSAAEVNFVSHDGSPALHDATLRVAAVEAAAVGQLRAAEIALRRSRLRLDAVQQLHAKGFASQRELDSARDAVSTARSLVERLRDRRERLVGSLKQLQTGTKGNRARADDPYPVSSDGELAGHVADWASEQVQPELLPRTLLGHVWAVEHLIDLRKRSCAAIAQGDAIAAEIKMLQKLRCKLEQTGVRGESIRRELSNLRLDIEYHQARALAATERVSALRWEEVRFVRQFVEQVKAGATGTPEAKTPPSFQTMRVVETDNANSPEDVQFVGLAVPGNRVAGRWPRLSYLESPLFVEDLTLCESLQWTFGIPAFSAWESPYRSRRSRSTISTREPFDCADDGPHLFSLDDRRRVCDDDPLDGPTLFSVNDLWRDRLRFYSPSYHDYYAFGERRSDRRPPRRRYWSYGTPPWYLPGYPTNFR